MTAKKINDKPMATIKTADLANEINQDPASVQLKNGKLVVFPDIFDWPTEQAEAFLVKINNRSMLLPSLKEWLDKGDYEALTAEYKTLRQLGPLVERVMNYYQGTWGTPGEGPASES